MSRLPDNLTCTVDFDEAAGSTLWEATPETDVCWSRLPRIQTALEKRRTFSGCCCELRDCAGASQLDLWGWRSRGIKALFTWAIHSHQQTTWTRGG